MNHSLASDIRTKTNDELIAAYTNSWDFLPDYIELVRTEMLQRGIPLDDLDAIKAQKEEVSDLTMAAGKQGNALYIAICFAFALFGGIIGIIAGYVYSNSKHTSLSGESYYVYNESTRSMGRWMMGIGVGVLIIAGWRALMRNTGL